MQSQEQFNSGTEHLDALIARLEGRADSELVVEHLQTAAAYLRGAMPDECEHNLKLANNDSDTLADNELKGELQHTVAEVMELLHPPSSHRRSHRPKTAEAPAAGAKASPKRLDAFFHGGDVKFGVFYPAKHVVAVFPSLKAAEAAAKALSLAGFELWEVIAVPGIEVRRFLEEIREHHTLWSALMTEFSRIIDTEANLVDDYARWARLGAGFLIARSATVEEAEGIFERVKPLDPLAVHWFMPGYIRHMM